MDTVTVTIKTTSTDGSCVTAYVKLTAKPVVAGFKLYQKGSAKALTTAIKKNKTNVFIALQKGKSVKLTADYFEPKNISDKKLVWKSPNTKIATVKCSTVKAYQRVRLL